MSHTLREDYCCGRDGGTGPFCARESTGLLKSQAAVVLHSSIILAKARHMREGVEEVTRFLILGPDLARHR